MSNSSLDGTLTLILGGVRSGKSRFGHELALELGGDDVLFVATAESRDDEMARRIDRHRRSRPSVWQTLECPLKAGIAIAAYDNLPSVVLVDCLTLLVTNVLLENEKELNGFDGTNSTEISFIENRMLAEIDDLIRIAESLNTHLIVVSGEVGMGLVPETPLGRLFRDLLGWSNQRIAARASSTYFMVAGMPIKVSELACSVPQAAQNLNNNREFGAIK